MLVAGLIKRRLMVEVVTTDPSGSLPGVEVRDNLGIRRFPTIRHDDVFFLSPSLAVWLLREAGRFDLVHAHSYHTPLALIGAIAARLRRVPFVISPYYHGMGHTAARQSLHRPYRLLGSWMIRQAALVICSSEAECSLIRQHFGDSLPTVVVEYGVDRVPAPTSTIRPAATGKTVLAGGRLEEYKQVDLVVRAVAHLPSDFRLVVFGDGPALEALEATARTIGVSERIEFVGRVPDAVLAQHFRSADVFVSLSRHESYGLTVVEAAAVGTAVVCSDIPAYREVAGRLPDGAVRLVDADADPAVAAEAITTAALAPRPVLPAASMIPSWDGMVAATIEGYRDALAARGRSLLGPSA
jgi:glycosyltransferase involved in cell wall biosynthesis